MRKVLLLGGTGEARAIATALADDGRFAVTASLAGVVDSPLAQKNYPVPMRFGGFGGIEGLAAYLRAEQIDSVIDATHPFAAQISHHASVACRAVGVRRFAYLRPAWQKTSGDDWCEFPDWQALIAQIPDGARVFLAAGQDGLRAFAETFAHAPANAPAHASANPQKFSCLIRTLTPHADLPQNLPPNMTLINALPAKTSAEESALLTHHRITHIACKNSGGQASRAKIDAARVLGLPVLLLARPTPPEPPVFDSVNALLSAVNLV